MKVLTSLALVEEEQGIPIDKNNELFYGKSGKGFGLRPFRNFGEKKLTSF
jgi:hypothetical protein